MFHVKSRGQEKVLIFNVTRGAPEYHSNEIVNQVAKIPTFQHFGTGSCMCPDLRGILRSSRKQLFHSIAAHRRPGRHLVSREGSGAPPYVYSYSPTTCPLPLDAFGPALLTRGLYTQAVPVVRTPDTPDALVDTRDRFGESLVLLPAELSQQLRLLQYLIRVQVPYAGGPRSAVDVMANYDGVLRRPRGYGELDLRVLRRKLGQVVLDEGTAKGGKAGRSAAIPAPRFFRQCEVEVRQTSCP